MLATIALFAVVAAPPATEQVRPLAPPSVKLKEEVEISSGAVTALPCAVEAKRSGKLDALSACSPAEADRAELVVFDVAAQEIYRLSTKAVYRFELEQAFGGGSIDLVGTVVKLDKVAATVDVTEYSITPKPKPGHFKGCL